MHNTASPPENTTKTAPHWAVPITKDPENAIAFLEEVMHGHGWDAVVYASADAPDLQALSKRLEKKGLKVQAGKDAEGVAVLHVREVGITSGLLHCFHELGLSNGATHTAEHAGEAIAQLGKTIKETGQYFTEDTARLLSFFYLIGDAGMILAGKGNKTSFKNLENILQSTSGALNLAQTIVYMLYAEGGKDNLTKNLQNAQTHAIANGGDATVPDTWGKLDPRDTLAQKTVGIFSDHAIGIGSGALVASQAALFASSALRGSKAKKLSEIYLGSVHNCKRAILSFIGWGALSIPKANEDSSPLFQWFSKYQEQISSLFTGGASVYGLKSGGKMDNKPQIVGEASYLFGDACLFFMDNNKYSKDPASQEKNAAEAAALFIGNSGLVLDDAAEKATVTKLAKYLAEQLPKPKGSTVSLEVRAERLAKGITENLPAHCKAYDHTVEAGATLLADIPLAQRPQAASILAETISKLPAVELESDAFSQKMLDELAFRERTGDAPTKHKHGDQLTKQIADLVGCLPPIASAEAALHLRDALTALRSQAVATAPDHAPKQQITANTAAIAPMQKQAAHVLA